jgi:tetratricopeptide (TPR) repeat protein
VLAVAALVAALGATATWGWQARRQAAALERLPAPPQATTPAIAEHVRSAFAVAAQQPTAIEAVGPLCLAYHADMLFGQAERCYDVAIELEPGNWRWVYYRAVIDGERGGGAAFVARLRRVLEAEPTYGPAWLRLGDAEFKAGRYEEAAAAWRRAETLMDPPRAQHSPAHTVEVPLAAYAGLGLARVALYTGDPAGAVKLLEPIVARVPGFGAPVRLLGDAYRALGQDAEAARAVARAARLPEFTPYADPMVDALARESRNSTCCCAWHPRRRCRQTPSGASS